MMNRIMKDENGVLTFEWILLITILVIGIIGGIAAIRDALIIEAAETAGAIVALDQSWTLSDTYSKLIVSDSPSGVAVSFTEIIGRAGTSYTDSQGSAKILSNN